MRLRPAIAMSVPLLGAGLLASCLTIDGGAIELSWVSYCASGKRAGGSGASCSCNERVAGLASVQLVLTRLGDGAATDACAGGATCRFAAPDQQGNSGFRVPPGEYDISLLPLDANGQVLGGPTCVPDGSANSCWQTPAPLRRTVVAGEVVSIGSLLIAVPDCPGTASCPAESGCPVTP